MDILLGREDVLENKIRLAFHSSTQPVAQLTFEETTFIERICVHDDRDGAKLYKKM